MGLVSLRQFAIDIVEEGIVWLGIGGLYPSALTSEECEFSCPYDSAFE